VTEAERVPGRTTLADTARRRVILADAPKRRLDANGIAWALGAAGVVPAAPHGGSPICWYAVRKAMLAATLPAGAANQD
jgi:hypothetical protein